MSKMWLATIDIVKAFNSITYDSIWKALGNMRYGTALHKSREEIVLQSESDSYD